MLVWAPGACLSSARLVRDLALIPLWVAALGCRDHGSDSCKFDPKSTDLQISLDPGPQSTQKLHHEKARPEFYQSPAPSSPFSHSFHLSPVREVRKTHDNLHDFQPSVYLQKLPTQHANDTITNRDAPNSHTTHLTNPGRRSQLTQKPTQSLRPHPNDHPPGPTTNKNHPVRLSHSVYHRKRPTHHPHATNGTAPNSNRPTTANAHIPPDTARPTNQ